MQIFVVLRQHLNTSPNTTILISQHLVSQANFSWIKNNCSKAKICIAFTHLKYWPKTVPFHQWKQKEKDQAKWSNYTSVSLRD